MSEDSGTRVPAGRYRLITPLGKRVMRGWDTHLRQVVAVRLFPPPDDSDQVVERASVLADLSHPGLARVLDAGTDDGEPFVVSEFIAGTTLKARLADGPLPAAMVGQLGVELAKTLAYAHSNGVLHRDVTPSSIMLGPGDEPFLTDLGIAETPTASYMAPEQVDGAEPAAAADVYALGLVLLESLTGRTEYPGSDAASKRARLTHPPRIEPETPYAAALEAMTRTDPAERPDAAACVDLLRGSSAKSRVQTRTVLLAAVSAAVVATGLALALNSPQPKPEPRGASVVEPQSTVTVRVTSGTPTVVEGAPVASTESPQTSEQPPQPPPGNPVHREDQGQAVGYRPSPSAPTLTQSTPPPPILPTVTATFTKKPKPTHPNKDDERDD